MSIADLEARPRLRYAVHIDLCYKGLLEIEQYWGIDHIKRCQIDGYEHFVFTPEVTSWLRDNITGRCMPPFFDNEGGKLFSRMPVTFDVEEDAVAFQMRWVS